MTSIATKTGDDGFTFDGETRVSKDDVKICLLGAVDELNCMLGVAYGYADVKTRNLINETQAHLFMFGTFILNGAPAPVQTWVEVMETDIVDWQAELPELEGFLKPRAYLQLCRAICRRAEREAVTYCNSARWDINHIARSTEDEKSIQSDNLDLIIKFLNRLSDWLFLLARKTDQMV